MFFSKKKDEKSEDLKRLEEKNQQLEEHLAAMERKFSRLTSQDEGVSGTSRKSSALKEVYEDQLQQVLEKNKELENKLIKVNEMMTQMEELERKKKEANQVPLLPNPPNNWGQPNPPFYGNGPMGYPGQQPGGMGYPGPHHPGNSGPYMPMGPQPTNFMQGPPQAPNPGFQPRPNHQMNFRPPPPLMDDSPSQRFGPRFNRPNYNKNYQKNRSSENQSGDKPFQNRDENRGRNQGRERPLFLNTEQNNRSKSQPRNKGKSNNPNEENGSMIRDPNSENEKQKQVRFEQKGRNRGRGNFHGNTFSNRNSNGPEHDRRTNFKRSSRGRAHDVRSRAHQNAEGRDSDDLSDSSNNSDAEEESNESTSADQSKPGVPDSSSMPDVVKHEKKKGKKSAQKKEDKKEKPVKEKANEENKKKENKSSSPKKNKPKKTEEKNKQDDSTLSKNNLGENELLKKFIGTSIPSLLDALCLQIDLNRKVSGVILMSDPGATQPILETPKTLFDIVNFKMKYPMAKSILL